MVTWISVLPALIVLTWAIVTHNVIASLILGIISAALIAHPTAPITAGTSAISAIYRQLTSTDNLLVFTFLICIGVIIQLMQTTGAIQSYVARIRQYIYTPLRAEIATLLGSFIFFLDDYLNAFTLGSMMAPVFDRLRISRTKLAYLLNATISPLCILIPATTWTAMILSQFNVAGIGSQQYIPNDSYATYLYSIALAIYPIMSIFTAYYMTITQSSYGLLSKETQSPTLQKNTTQHTSHSQEHENTSLIEFTLPMLIFITSIIISFLYLGDAALIGGSNTFLTALQTADSSLALALAAGISTLISVGYFYRKKRISAENIPSTAYSGFMLMFGSLCVLTLAWSLNDLLIYTLHTPEYLAEVFTANITNNLLPLVIFILTTIITASTGSAWGTLALMIPLTARLLLRIAPEEMPILLEQIPYAFPTLSAVLSGSIAGGHFSPISDATIVASTSSGAHHISHVTSQIQYSIPPFIGALSGYTIICMYDMTYNMTLLTCLGTGTFVTYAMILITTRVWRA